MTTILLIASGVLIMAAVAIRICQINCCPDSE